MEEIKNIKKAAKRIKEAVEKKERIIILGDADLDGMAAVVILKEAVMSLGGKVSAVYFPDREQEGHGITETAINYLKERAPALLIAVDCGIGNFKEVKLAKEFGLKVIILDHHEVIDRLPEAEIVVDPKQKGDKSSFEYLSATGVVFKLTEVLLKKKMPDILRRNFLELVSLATLADMMPKVDDNLYYIEEGLSSLKDSFRPGIKMFFGLDFLKSSPNLEQKVFKIISILNTRDVKDRLPASYRLLTTPSIEEARIIVADLLEKNKIRREKIREVIEILEEEISGKEEPIIFSGEENFDLELTGVAASIICQKYGKPVFLYKKMKEESQGTIKTPADVNGVELMKKCADLLLTFGGHPRAAGFRIKNENLDKFRKCLIENYA